MRFLKKTRLAAHGARGEQEWLAQYAVVTRLAERLPAHSARRGNYLNYFQDFRAENGSS